MRDTLTFEADDISAFKALMTEAGFQQHELAWLAGHANLWVDLHKLVTGQAIVVDTAHTLPTVEGSGSSTVMRRGNNLWHDGRRLGVLQCSDLKDVKTYADLAAYFKPEAHPPEEVLKFLADNPRFVPSDWCLRKQGESWVIFLSTRHDKKVFGLTRSTSIHRSRWDAGDTDELEETDHIIVYEDSL